MERITRRAFLKKAGVAVGGGVAIGTTVGWVLRGREVQDKFDLPEGVWSQNRAEELAQSMMAETQFNDISFAGSVLMGNLHGESTLSTFSKLYVDDPLRLITVEIIGTNPKVEMPMSAWDEQAGDKMDLELKAKNQKPTQKITGTTPLRRLAEIRFVREQLGIYSPFAVNFLTAKEIYNIKALDLLANVAYNIVSADYYMPSDEKQINGVKTYLASQALVSSEGEVPNTYAIDFWAHFLMIPNFLKAKKQGRFTNRELSKLDIFRQSAEYFTKAGILSMDGYGNYQWVGSAAKVYGTWVEASAILYRYFGDINGSEQQR